MPNTIDDKRARSANEMRKSAVLFLHLASESKDSQSLTYARQLVSDKSVGDGKDESNRNRDEPSGERL